MPTIVTVRYPSGVFFDGQPAVDDLPEARSRDDLHRMVELARPVIKDDGELVVIYPAWAPEPTLRRLQTVRSLLDTAQITTYGAHLPPLAGSVFVSLAAALTRHVPSTGLLLAALPRLERQLISITRLSRLGCLREPAPSVWQHAVSWWPWNDFVVVSWPEPGVRRLSRTDRSVPLPKLNGPAEVAMAVRDGDRDWVRDVVIQRLGEPPVREVEVSSLADEWWGPGPLVELVAYPTNLSAIAAVVTRGLHRWRCTWCRRDVTTGRCPYCGLTPVEEPTEDAA